MRNRNMTKKGKILMAFQNGDKLTAAKAYALTGSMRLAANVFALRSEGYNIMREDREDLNGILFTEYRLQTGVASSKALVAA